MRKDLEACVVFALLIGCANEARDGEFRGETESHGTSDTGATTRDTGATTSDTGATTSDVGTDEPGCVSTQGYWKNHNASAEQPHNQIAWPIAEDTAICDSTWLEILWTPPKGDAWIILAHHWIAASLNVAAGAAVSAEVQATLDEAAGMLDACAIAGGDRAHALELSDMLDAYNNGMMGTDHCDDGEDDDGEDDDDGGSSGCD